MSVAIDNSACIAVAGLLLDILGVAILFAKTSPRHIEAYITVSSGRTPFTATESVRKNP